MAYPTYMPPSYNFGYQTQQMPQMPQIPQPTPQQYTQPIQQEDRIWVQGKGGAEAYLVVANGSVRLWDSTAPIFYEKRADSTGRPTLEAFKYERINQPVQPNFFENQATNDYSERLLALERRILALEGGTNVSESNAADPTV